MRNGKLRGNGNGYGRGSYGGYNKVARVDRSGGANGDGPNNEAFNQGIRCYICKGPHRKAKCPHKSALNAMEGTERGGDKSSHPTEGGKEEPAIVGSIRFLYALRIEEERARTEPERGLMYVDLVVNKKSTKALVDTGATDTFISPEEARRCNLQVTNNDGRLKAMNSAALSIVGSVKKVPTKVGSWEGNVHYTVTPMDDFDVVLGMDFLILAEAIPLPAATSLLFQGACPGVVPATLLKRKPEKTLAAIRAYQEASDDAVDEDVDKLGGGECCGHPFV
ncbi:hypothetical protein GQ457_01G006930 [Hibiscus cannabinus]